MCVFYLTITFLYIIIWIRLKLVKGRLRLRPKKGSYGSATRAHHTCALLRVLVVARHRLHRHELLEQPTVEWVKKASFFSSFVKARVAAIVTLISQHQSLVTCTSSCSGCTVTTVLRRRGKGGGRVSEWAILFLFLSPHNTAAGIGGKTWGWLARWGGGVWQLFTQTYPNFCLVSLLFNINFFSKILPLFMFTSHTDVD